MVHKHPEQGGMCSLATQPLPPSRTTCLALYSRAALEEPGMRPRLTRDRLSLPSDDDWRHLSESHCDASRARGRDTPKHKKDAFSKSQHKPRRLGCLMTSAFRKAAKSSLATRVIQSRWQSTRQKSLGICDEPSRLAHTVSKKCRGP